MLPILLLAGLLGLVGYKLGSTPDRKIRPISFGAVPGAMGSARRALPAPGQGQPSRTPYLDFMTRIVAAGHVPNQNVVDAAYAEASAVGDVATMQTIQALVYQWAQQAAVAQLPQAPAPQEQVLAGSEGGDDPGDLGDYEMANPTPQAPVVQTPQVQAQAPQPIATNSPIDGVDTDEWCQLVRALKTKEAAFASENYLGSYEHNRRRLRQLGIDDGSVATEDGQYRALVTDLTDHLKNSQKLVEDFCGDVVEVEGTAYPVTLSGVLGLLKTAGPKGAEGWLRNPEDRKAFPQTTAAFVRCNGHF